MEAQGVIALRMMKIASGGAATRRCRSSRDSGSKSCD
jgi:hypothetical protein